MEPDRPKTTASRLLGVGARGADRLASATGVDRAVEDAIEESIVRALQSPAVERAIVRLIEQNAIQDAIGEALTSEELARLIADALDTQVADQVWAELLAGNKVQMLVERIAEAPEVRAAITQQGFGLLTDVGHRLTAVTEALDDAAERFVRRVGISASHDDEQDEVGLVTRAVAGAIDLGLIGAFLSLVSGLLASVFPVATGEGEALPAWALASLSTLGFLTGASILVAFWALVGQTPGMRLLSIHLDAGGSREIGLRRAIRRMVVAVVGLLTFGLGFLAILRSPTRLGWHDRAAGTVVRYDQRAKSAPWATLDRAP